jgi:hypothetical protein
MKIMSRLDMVLEPRLSQECEVCAQEVLSERQIPLNAILILDYSICPSCRQGASVLKRHDQRYRRKWRRFVKDLRLDG